MFNGEEKNIRYDTKAKKKTKRRDEEKKKQWAVNLPTNLEELDTFEIEARWQKTQSQSLIYRCFFFFS